MPAIHVRLSKEDHAKAKKDAKKAGVSLNDILILCIRKVKITTNEDNVSHS